MAKELLTGNEILTRGALAAGAKMMTGYPITPTSEIIEHWAEAVAKDSSLKFLQTEDEMSAGFAMIGGVLAGVKAFTATSGPGNVLMQDAFSMAENMRLPTVAFIMQRGGPSTGTVIYSQQELNLTCFGGNGEGLRIVYSSASIQDLYDYAIKSFNTAWRYRFPTFVLGDGYQSKELAEAELHEPQDLVEAIPYLLGPNKEAGTFSNLRNTYNLEEELGELIASHKKFFDEAIPELVEFEDVHTLDADLVIFAHGIVSTVAREVQDELRQKGLKVGMFRPITLSPFPTESAKQAVTNKKAVLIVESSLGQFASLVKSQIPLGQTEVYSLYKPAMGVTKQEISQKVEEILKK